MSSQKPSPYTSPLARAIAWLIPAQYEMVWKPARLDRGVLPGPDAIPGYTHPDVGKALRTLAPEGQLFVTMLVLKRIEHFKQLARQGKLETLINIGAGTAELSESLQQEIAEQFHIDWWETRKSLGLSGHAGDKDWAVETPEEQMNDLMLVNKWCSLLHYCATAGKDGQDTDLVSLIDLFRAG